MANKRTLSMWLVAGFLMGSVVTGPPILYFGGYFHSNPYSVYKVVHEFNEDRSELYLQANFKKTSCTFDRLVVYGEEIGEWFPLPWEDLDTGKKDVDRLEGEHTLRISIGPITRDYSRIQIRTRHICNGEKVDKVFAEVEF